MRDLGKHFFNLYVFCYPMAFLLKGSVFGPGYRSFICKTHISILNKNLLLYEKEQFLNTSFDTLRYTIRQ